MAKRKNLQLSDEKAEETLFKLGNLQAKNPVKTTTEEEVRLIKGDRNRWR